MLWSARATLTDYIIHFSWPSIKSISIMRNCDLFLVIVTWLCGSVGSTFSAPDGGDSLTRFVRDLGFRDDIPRRGGSCRPLDIDDDDEDQLERRQIYKCCRRYGNDFYDVEEGRWRHRPSRDEFDDESRFERRRRRFWRPFCRRYRRRTSASGGTEDKPRRVTDEDEEDIDPNAGFRLPVSEERKSAPKAAATPARQKSTPSPLETTTEEDDDEPVEGAKPGTGQSAAAGNAKVGSGSGTSINQANLKTNPFGSVQSALSANAGTGKNVGVDGAAQNKGASQNARGASKGTAAAAGQANVKEGQGISINTADLRTNARGVSGSSLSAGSATGNAASAGGAALVGGANARRPTITEDDDEK